MKYMTGNEIRKAYLQFFKSKEHLILHSFPLIPENDPSLLLIGAGIPAARAQRRVVGQAQVIAKPDQPHDFLLPRPLKPRAAGLSAITSARVARQPWAASHSAS